MFHKSVVPVVLLACWTPFPSALAEGKGTAGDKKEGAIDKREGAVDFKNTIGMISRLHRQLDYEQALDLIGLARERPLGTSELVTLSLYEGIILYEMGRQVESGDAFQMALLIRRDAKLPEPVSPKIESHFETFRRRVQQELDSATRPEPGSSGTRSTTPAASSPDCPSSRIAAKGRTLKAQQLWRLTSMEQMLCVRGIRGGEATAILSALKAQVSEASTGPEWLRIDHEIDQLSRKYSVYPSNEDWRQAKASVPEDLWDVGDEDQDVPLPEAPVSVASSQSEQDPVSLFGCRATVAPECERLMRRLLLLQNQIPGMDAEDRRTARKELLLLGKKVREANSSEILEDASSDIDAWQGRWH